MKKHAVRPERSWNTWDPVYPAELIHLPSGGHVAVTAYSDALGAFTRLPPGHHNGVTLGPRSIDAGHIDLEVDHGGTRLALAVERNGDDSVRISWETLEHGEWGLRFWLCICLWCDDGDGVAYDPATTELHASTPGGHVVAKGPRFPLMATFHNDLDALAQEYEEHGYFYLASRGTTGPVGVLRYNLEEMGSFEVAVAWAENRADASLAADAALAKDAKPAPAPQHTGYLAGALDAVRDCVAWSTVWDRHNDRSYTQQSRNWVAQKFGGWGVWLNDSVYHGLLAGLVDTEVTHENQRAIFAGATEWGNLPCLLTGNDAWVDRTQPPIVSWVTWMHYLRSRDRQFIDDGWTPLHDNHTWWWRERDGNKNGLVEYGTSPVGDGLYRGTKLAAKDESMMDNSPVHDEASLMAESRTLDCEDIGLNCFLALDGEMLALMASELGHDEEAKALAEQSDGLKRRIREQLWDPDRRIFANRLWSGKFTDSVAPTSFYAMLCGAATAEQADDLVNRHLRNTEEFWGDWPVPACARSDPAFKDNVYWRGRVWPPLNFATYMGLRRYGYDDVARDFARRCYELFMLNWANERICGENFSAITGRADDQPDTDLFYTWGAVLSAIAVAEISDVNPWQGWTLTHGSDDVALHDLSTPVGLADIEVADNVLRVRSAGETLLETNARGRLCHVELSPTRRAMMLPSQTGEVRVGLPDTVARRLVSVTLDGQPCDPMDVSHVEVKLDPGAGGHLVFELTA